MAGRGSPIFEVEQPYDRRRCFRAARGHKQTMANGSFCAASLSYHPTVFPAATMLCFFTVGVFGASLVCWLIASLTAWGRFSDYCDVVAKVEGREAGRKSSWMFEDGSNVFELEQAWKLVGRPYLRSNDEKLRAAGNLAWTSEIWALLWTIATVLLGLIARFDVCGA